MENIFLIGISLVIGVALIIVYDTLDKRTKAQSNELYRLNRVDNETILTLNKMNDYIKSLENLVTQYRIDTTHLKEDISKLQVDFVKYRMRMMPRKLNLVLSEDKKVSKPRAKPRKGV